MSAGMGDAAIAETHLHSAPFMQAIREPPMRPQMRLDDAKGFGSITSDVGGDDRFWHCLEIQARGFNSLQENQRVRFDVVAEIRGQAGCKHPDCVKAQLAESGNPGMPGFLIACAASASGGRIEKHRPRASLKARPTMEPP